MIVPNLKEQSDDVDLGTGLSGHMTRAEGEIEILDKEKYIRGELDPLAEESSGGILAGNRNKEGSHFGAISVPRESIKN